jgi:hypothetical protein
VGDTILIDTDGTIRNTHGSRSGTTGGAEVSTEADRSDAQWLREFDARNKDTTEDEVRQALREARMMDEHHRLQYQQAQAEADRLAEALERLVRPPALNLLDPANSGDLEAARHVLKRRREKL